jgi:hypothetical protein
LVGSDQGEVIILNFSGILRAVNHAIDHGGVYEVALCPAKELKGGGLEACFAIIREGGAVRVVTMKRDLPRASVIAIARQGDLIVGVGAIKPVRKQYAEDIATKSHFAFPADTPELGYVAVAAAHEGHGLSHRITESLLSQHAGRLFATTDTERMKKTLSDAGFAKKGDEWPGERGMLSYWERLQKS